MSFQPLEPEDVINIDQTHLMNNMPSTAQHHEMVGKLKQAMFSRCSCSDEWFTKGVPCKMLRSGHQWKTGRIQLQFQFEEDASNT